MKKIYLIIAILVTYTGLNAQSYTGETKINSLKKMAVINELPYAAEIAEDAIKKKMTQLGFSGKEDDGYLIYKKVSMPTLGPATYNLYFKAERKSKKEKEQSLVYMLISDSYEAFLSETRDMQVVSNAKDFLNTLSVQAEDVYVESEIAKQEELVRRAEKSYTNAVDDGRDLEKKRQNLEEDIKKNKDEQEVKRLEIEKQKQLLENARGKRKVAA